MASATDSERNDEGDLALSWSGRWTLGHRIFAVNILTLLIFALSILYLDSYRDRLMVERRDRIAGETQIAAEALEAAPPRSRPTMLHDIGQANQSRLRVFGRDGKKIGDSWSTGAPTYQLRDPRTEQWRKGVARALDRGFNALVGTETPPDFIEPPVDDQAAWPLLATAGEQPLVEVRNAPDLTPVFVAGVKLADGSTLLVTKNDRNLTRTVRSQRGSPGLALGLVMAQVLIHVINPQSFHWTMGTRRPWVVFAVVTVALISASAGAALLAGRRALSMDAVRAVREDW